MKVLFVHIVIRILLCVLGLRFMSVLQVNDILNTHKLDLVCFVLYLDSFLLSIAFMLCFAHECVFMASIV
jgi:hypothetical protein